MKNSYVNNYKILAPKSKKELLNYVRDYHGILVAMNAEKILKKDKRLQKLINENLGYPDGIGAVWALKQKGLETTKIAGAEFWLDIINNFKLEKSFYFIGGSSEVINETINKLEKEFPNLNIKGHRNGFISSDNERKKLIQHITQEKPNVVFVAMGTPKQEFLMEQIQQHHPNALYMGLGGSFDVYTGKKKRAPKVFQKLGLEWFHRLLLEPTRIKRQIVYLQFMWLLTLRRL